MQPDLRKKRLVIIPGSGRELLRQELSLALGDLGFEALLVRSEEFAQPESVNYLPRLIEKKPSLFLSVNLQGLIPGSIHTRPLLEAGVPVLAWFVDNPWHQLSAMRDPSWKELHLAVTDQSFIQPLKAAGASSVIHMPLAGSPQLMRPTAPASETMANGGNNLLAAGKGGNRNSSTGQALNRTACLSPKLRRVVFAGRSAFPGLDEFFAGQELPEDIFAKAAQLIQGVRQSGNQAQCVRPDFAWWVRELGLAEEQERFWPGKKARKPGKGAAKCNALWRKLCIESLADDLTVFGNPGWGKLADLRPPVDYYTQLPSLYQAAEFSLNLNSLLLPAGLSQRIFDVWLADGFCLTDYSPGLEIFPPELVGEITFSQPKELPELLARLGANPARKERLRCDWKEHILSQHSYEKRLKDTLGSLGLL